jgi:hypothetical protein
VATPGILPPEIASLLDVALVGELTVVDAKGRPVTYPVLPFYDGRVIFLTSAVLFSRKLRHIKANPKVSIAFTDPVGVPATPFHRATVQGEARVFDEDLHAGWERALPAWRAKEPVIDSYLKKRFGIPLFFERAIVEITPVRAFLWEDADTRKPPRVLELVGAR